MSKENKQFKSYGKFINKELSKDSNGMGIIKVSGWASKAYENGMPVIDRDSEHVDTRGFDLTNAKVMLFNHDTDRVIGKIKLSQRAEGIWLDGEIHEVMDKKAFYAAKEGILDSFSIGFTITDYEFLKVNGEDIVSFTKGAVHECSLVAIPANTRAMIENTEVIKSMIKDGECTGLQCSVKNLKAMNPDCECLSEKELGIGEFLIAIENGLFDDFEERVTELTTEAENTRITENMKKHWNLGPEVALSDPQANPEYWQKMAEVWDIAEEDARRRLCANCEYFNNTPEAMKEMDMIPQNAYDVDGGGRGYCHEFKFICHNLRTCQAWEEKEYEIPDEGEKEIKREIMTKEMETQTSEVVEATPATEVTENTEILEGGEKDTPAEPVEEPTTEQVEEQVSTEDKVEEKVSEEVDAPVEQSVTQPTVQTIIGTLATVNLNELSVEEIEAIYNSSADIIEKIEALVKADIEGDE